MIEFVKNQKFEFSELVAGSREQDTRSVINIKRCCINSNTSSKSLVPNCSSRRFCSLKNQNRWENKASAHHVT